MKVLAIDFGTKNVGLALSDESGQFAFAFDTLRMDKKKNFAKEQTRIVSDIKNICMFQKVEQVVVGLPTNLSEGKATQMTEIVFHFVEQLEAELKLLKIKVETRDERWTTFQASRMENKNSRNIDELSAQVLLQDYLDQINI